MGTFRDCPEFQLTYTVTYTPKVQGDTHRYDRIETHWFGKNTGPIKRTVDWYVDDAPVRRAVHEATGYTAAKHASRQ